MTRPLVVYLDSQDFSKFTDALHGRGTPGVHEVLEFLLSEIDGGRVIAPVSMAHLSELIQYEGGGRELALRKAKTVERISKEWAFRYPSDIFRAELLDLAAKRKFISKAPKLSAHFPLDVEGKWSPTISPKLTNFRAEIAADMEETLQKELGKHNSNRLQRRKIKSQMSKGILQNISSLPAFKREISMMLSEYPLTEYFKEQNLLTKLILGQVSPEVVESELFRSIHAPTRFVIWYFEKIAGKRDMPRWLRSFGGTLMSGIEKSRDKMNSSSGLSMPLRVEIFEKVSSGLRLSLAKSLAATELPEENSEVFTEATISALLSDVPLTAMPTISAVTLVMIEYLRDNAGLMPTDRKVKVSDGGDIFHSIYACHSDIWRGDGYSSGLVARALKGSSTKVVGKLLDLPE